MNIIEKCILQSENENLKGTAMAQLV